MADIRSQPEQGFVEETLLEHAVPHGGALPPHLFTNRPFLWLVLAEGVSHVALWGLFAAVWSEASFGFGATPAQMSLLLASFSLPFVLMVPFQGILVDRWSPKWVSVLGYLVSLLAIGVALPADSIDLLYVSMFLAAAGFAAVAPARSSLTGLLVSESGLVQANGMLSASIQLALVVGGLGGGFLLRSDGGGPLYVAALAVMAVSVLLLLPVPDRRHGQERPAMTVRDVVDGLAVSWRQPDLQLLLFLAAAGWVLVNVFFALEPLFIKGTLRLSEDAIPFLWAAHGTGALVGALWVSRVRRGAGRELGFVGGGFVIAGVGLLLYVGTAVYPVAVVGTAVMGGGFSVYFASSLALIQRAAGREKRGRVTSVFSILQEGSALVASALIVGLGRLVVVRPTLAGGGVGLALVGLLGLRSLSRLRRVSADA